MALDRSYEDDADGPGEARPEALRHRGSDASAPKTEVAETRSHAEYYEALRAADGGREQAPDDAREQANGRTEQVDGRVEQRDGKAGRTDGRTEQADGMAEQVEGQAAQVDGSDRDADMRTERSGWDTVDPGNRPPLDDIRISPERAVHILDGDSPRDGGHRHGTGKPGKTEFPASWNDEKVINTILDVARKPDEPPVHQDRNDSWLCIGSRDNVEVSVVILRSGEIVTGWPEEGGPGVVRNPRRGTS